jgi:hypothetical protein
MAVAGGFDLHRGQLTFDYVDTGTGESRRGRICPADRESLRGWLRRFGGVPGVEFAVEGCTGWRYVVEELQRAGITAHLAEPAETAGLRGSKRHAKTDWADARHLRCCGFPKFPAVDHWNSPGDERCGGPGMSLRGCQVLASCPVSPAMVAVMRWRRRGGWPRPGPGGTASGSCRRRCSGRRFGAAAGRAWRRRSSGRR